jgi:4-amino-4-deoxy-L-arabinose transferase-like glycosyltransferase
MTRPLLPIDETRYLAVAWEMWTRGDWLVLHLNGVPYHHKPPLLFWLIDLGWALFGVSEIWARVVAPLFGLGSLWLTAVLGRLLYPDQPRVAETAPLILIGTALFALFATLTFFDTMIVFFTLLGLIGVVRAWRGRPLAGWMLFALALGLGVLSKGPVQLLHLAPVPLLAPLWMGRERPASWGGWYGGLGLGVLGGAALALAWAVPAAFAGGPEYGRMLFLGQTTGRIVESFQHGQPWWWYVPVTFAVLFPWTWWLALYRRQPAAIGMWHEVGTRFCLCLILPVFVAFSAISGKQPHYLLPLFPAFALIVGRRLASANTTDLGLAQAPVAVLVFVLAAVLLATPFAEHWPAWLRPRSPLPPWVADIEPWSDAVLFALGTWLFVDRARTPAARAATLAATTVVLLAVAHLAVFAAARPYYDVRPSSAVLRAVEEQGRPIAHINDYEGQFHFLGRLTKPIAEIAAFEAEDWARRHPDGVIITYRRDDPATFGAAPLFRQVFRGRPVVLWEAAQVLAHGQALLVDRSS